MMKDKLSVKDFRDFFKNNFKIILGSIILLFISTTAYTIYNYRKADDNEKPSGTPIEITKSTLSKEKYEELAEWPLELYSDGQIKQMQAHLLPYAYKLTIYVEHENNEPIANTTFMREVFRNKEVLKFIESRLGEKLTPAIELAVHIENLGNSGVYELHFQRGTREESLELAHILIDAIEEKKIPVLNNKTVDLIDQEPEPVLLDYSEFEEDTANDSKISFKLILKILAFTSIFSITLGLIIGILLALFRAVLSKNISPLYDYAREESDKIIRLNHFKSIDTKSKIDKGLNNINQPLAYKKIILLDAPTEKELKEILSKLSSNTSYYTDFSLVQEKVEKVDEIVILTLVNKTTKNWYNNQRVQLNGYDLPIKIIQF